MSPRRAPRSPWRWRSWPPTWRCPRPAATLGRSERADVVLGARHGAARGSSRVRPAERGGATRRCAGRDHLAGDRPADGDRDVGPSWPSPSQMGFASRAGFTSSPLPRSGSCSQRPGVEPSGRSNDARAARRTPSSWAPARLANWSRASSCATRSTGSTWLGSSTTLVTPVPAGAISGTLASASTFSFSRGQAKAAPQADRRFDHC